MILRKTFVLAAALIATPALAQQATPPFVPFMIDEAAFKQLHDYLDGQPLKFARPLADWLDFAERKAASEKAEAETKAKEKPPQ